MTLEEHATAIEAAIQAAYEDGYQLDNGFAEPISELELNRVQDGQIWDFVPIRLPEVAYYGGAV
ncbi:hypothetical protein AB0L74_10440 [Streptomyces sp. NPDC052020]|uniref:hypothetical protein n=1 Tax=Streptomyces sp. NPDC052020 TaxID=3155677 RepID=UPI00343AF582